MTSEGIFSKYGTGHRIWQNRGNILARRRTINCRIKTLLHGDSVSVTPYCVSCVQEGRIFSPLVTALLFAL